MADNVTAEAVVTPGAVFATDDQAGVQHPYVKLEWGADNTYTKVDSGVGALPIQDGGNSITVDGAVSISGAVAVTQSGTWDEVGINDSGNSITVDNPQLSVVGGGVEATAMRVTIASDSTGVLSVDDNGASLTVDGSVTANAGTNLNTSALAVEAGGNLADAAASLAVIDDWDESDRAKVNPIVGQAGVQGGSGAVSALTQRVVLATDVALPTGTNSIGTVVDGGSGKTLKTAVFSITASGNLVAAVASKIIKVYAYEIQSRSDTVTLQIFDDNGGNAVSTDWSFNTREGVMASSVNPPSFLFKNSTQNKPIYGVMSGTGTIKGCIRYWDDDAA